MTSSAYVRRRILIGAAFVVVVGCFSTAMFARGTGFLLQSTPLLNERILSEGATQQADSLALARVQAGMPKKILIPSLGVSTSIDYVSLTPQGNLGVPKGPATVGWYLNGPRPGDVGSAVIDGHFGWAHGIPAVFDNLHTLQAGDAIIVVDDHGDETHFSVRKLQTYGVGQIVPEIFYSFDAGVHLNLITCEGAWNSLTKSYANRLVVFSDQTR